MGVCACVFLTASILRSLTAPLHVTATSPAQITASRVSTPITLTSRPVPWMPMKLNEIYRNELQISTNDFKRLQNKERLQGIASLALSPCSNAGVDEDDDTLGTQACVGYLTMFRVQLEILWLIPSYHIILYPSCTGLLRPVSWFDPTGADSIKTESTRWLISYHQLL